MLDVSLREDIFFEQFIMESKPQSVELQFIIILVENYEKLLNKKEVCIVQFQFCCMYTISNDHFDLQHVYLKFFFQPLLVNGYNQDRKLPFYLSSLG